MMQFVFQGKANGEGQAARGPHVHRAVLPFGRRERGEGSAWRQRQASRGRKAPPDRERGRTGTRGDFCHRKISATPQNRQITEQISEFIESRRGLGRDEKYVCELRRKLFRLVRECSWKTVRDVNGYSFEKWRARQPLSAKTRNEYHNALTVFCNWVEPRTGTNPMRFIEKVEAAWDSEAVSQVVDARGISPP